MRQGDLGIRQGDLGMRQGYWERARGDLGMRLKCFLYSELYSCLQVRFIALNFVGVLHEHVS